MNKPTTPCIICLSPYRNEIVKLKNEGVKTTDIYRKYATLMGYKSNPESFYMLIKRHIDKGHVSDKMVIPRRGPRTTIDAFGQKMLEMGMIKIESMDPDEVQLKDVISAQKLILDAKKLKITEDAMGAMLGKLFGPTNLIIEGEVSE